MPCWIHRYKQTASVGRIDVVIVLLLPPRSVIGPLFEGKIWSMVSRLPSSVNKIALRARQHGRAQATRMMPHSGVEGGRSHGANLLDEAMGLTNGDGADGEGAQSADREPMDRHDTTGFRGRDRAVAMTPEVEPGYRRSEVEPERLRAEAKPEGRRSQTEP